MRPKRKAEGEPDDGVPRLTSRQAALKKNKEEEATKAQTARDNAAAELARLNEQANARPAGNPGERNDGTFHMSFVQMGQGDCAVVCTPKGRVIVIDCGTNSQDRETQTAYRARVRGILNNVKYLGTNKVIDVLILTHPDKDHYNRIVNVLANFQVKSVYHSSKLSEYGSAATGWLRLTCAKNLIQSLVLNQDDGVPGSKSSLAGGAIQAAVNGAPKAGRLDPALNGLIVVDETNTAGQTTCRITLLASGVAHDYAVDNDAGEHRNRGSVVTLIEVFGRRILLCGDATRSTEHFLLLNANRKARLANLDIVQAGHHGSDVTSSATTFVTWVNAQHRVIISAGRRGQPAHHLPGWPVVNRYIQRFEGRKRPKDTDGHLVSAWDITTTLADPIARDVFQPVYTTGSNGTWSLDVTPTGEIQ